VWPRQPFRRKSQKRVESTGHELTHALQESKQKTVELKDDNPIALEQAPRYLYGLDLQESDDWRFWMHLHVAADRFCSTARVCDTAEEVFDILEAIHNDLSYNNVFVKLASELRGKHLIALLSNDRFRAQLDSGGKEALWQQLDELTSKLMRTDIVEKGHYLCATHEATIFLKSSEAKGFKDRCYCCVASRGRHNVESTVARVAWTKE
jgi:hypothetical protein